MARDPWKTLRANTKRRAKRRGITYGLTDADWIAMRERANDHCEVSGLPFSWTRYAKRTIRPMAPSVDRIDSSKGYTRDNVRIVLFCCNCAMGSWGEDYLYGWAKVFVNEYERKNLGAT